MTKYAEEGETFRVGFIMNGEEVAKVIHPTRPSDVTVDIGGAITAIDYDGEVHILAAGEWTGVTIRKVGD